MNLFALLVLAQMAAPARQTLPVLAFPEPGLDDSAAYQGYQTRLFRDAAGNTVQVYLDARSGRVVHLLADAEDESVGFSVRDQGGRPAKVQWAGPGAEVSSVGNRRTFEHRLFVAARAIHLGWFQLGSMRIERDLQYSQYYRKQPGAFADPAFRVAEFDRLLAAIARLPKHLQRDHLALLHASDIRALRSRLAPTITAGPRDGYWRARIVQPALDGLDTLVLEVRVNLSEVTAVRGGDSLSLRARHADRVTFTVHIETTGKALTPLTREQIFTPAFLRFLAAADTNTLRGKWLERETRGVELLSSREKLMAGLPNFATYFGRDMLVTALMMRPIWRQAMSEFAIASALRKLGPDGDVSHEEALGGQAIREAAAEYAALIDTLRSKTKARGAESAQRAKDDARARARTVLQHVRATRENYHMIDDEFQLVALEARWLGDTTVSADRKRAFLRDTSDSGEPRVNRVLRELALVARWTAPYAANPAATHLVSFPARDSSHWQSSSWRDSNEGYAGGRFAMDVNAIWAPHALDGIAVILRTLPMLGFSLEMSSGPLGTYVRDSTALNAARDRWWDAWRHFLVQLGPAQVRSHVAARLAALPESERRYWTALIADAKADEDSLAFLALSLDGQGRPIGVANSDPSTRLFLGDPHETTGSVLRDVHLFVRHYPVGLFVERVGPVVSNDAYAPPSVWPQFVRDTYHGPRVVWGREVNLFLIGVANHIATAGDSAYARDLRAAQSKVMAAVQSSGFHSELWSYEFGDGRPVPVRYGISSDVQLWSTTDLALQFALSLIR